CRHMSAMRLPAHPPWPTPANLPFQLPRAARPRTGYSIHSYVGSVLHHGRTVQIGHRTGRAVGSICPALVGHMGGRMPFADHEAIGYLAAGAYLLVILSVLTLPEIRRRELTVATDSTFKNPGQPWVRV